MSTEPHGTTPNDMEGIPMLPMRDIVAFPHMTAPFFIGRPRSMAALEHALHQDRTVFVVAQKDPEAEDPSPEDFYSIGTVGKIMQIMRLQNGTIKALFEAKKRAHLVTAHLQQDYYAADISMIDEPPTHSPELLALSKNVQQDIPRYLKEVKRHTDGIEKLALDTEEPYRLADRLAPILNMDLQQRQTLLENLDPLTRLQQVYERMLEELEVKQVEQKLRERVQGQIGKTQKEYYLNEQVKAIQKELGQGEEGKAEIEEYLKQLETKPLSEEAKTVAEKEIKKLKGMPPMSAEANVVRNYLDWLLGMPWGEKSEDNFDLEHAENILDQEHYGLEKIKERIVEYLAVAKKVGKVRGPIICLAGPPGVGKTTLARSVANALGKKFIRVSLGGIRDEAEIRGHRRTYVGALPGKVIQSVKKAKTQNPLILLDEIDKLSRSVMGDPASALLEVLDPEQNHVFMDHYLEVEFDLSDVLFFCTANVVQDIPPALKDRMELISLAGYTELEKEHIATQHLIPKQVEENGLSEDQIKISKPCVSTIIQRYTREAGVRNLERTLAKVCRKVATQLVQNPNKSMVNVNPKKLETLLGPPKYKHRSKKEHNEIGVTSGLAWTQVGGELLVTEVSTMDGSGKLQLTGNLGDVMKESAQAALSYVRANANYLGIYSSVFKNTDIHMHVPEGAVPKDGPSAGVTITTSLVSALTGIPVHMEVAMTGEVTLRGRVLPIGGLKEKLLAAKRAGMQTVVIPYANQKDLADIPKEITKALQIIPVRHVDEVLKIALERFPVSVHESEDDHNNKAESETQTENPTPEELLKQPGFEPTVIDPGYPARLM